MELQFFQQLMLNTYPEYSKLFDRYNVGFEPFFAPEKRGKRKFFRERTFLDFCKKSNLSNCHYQIF